MSGAKSVIARSAQISSGDITAGWMGIVVFSPGDCAVSPRKSPVLAPAWSQGGIGIRSSGSRNGA